MKLTKARLKKLIKEELLKEARNFGRPPIKRGRGSITMDTLAPTDKQRQYELEEAMDVAASLSEEMTAILSNLDINDEAAIEQAHKDAKKIANKVPMTLLRLKGYLEKTHYFLDDEDLEFEDPSQQRMLKYSRSKAMSPRQPYDVDKFRGNK